MKARQQFRNMLLAGVVRLVYLLIFVMLPSLMISQARSASSISGFPNLPRDVQTTIDELLSLARKSYNPREIHKYADAFGRFHRLLGELHKKVGDDLFQRVCNSRGQRIEKNLIMMARDQVEHPERRNELADFYSKPARGKHILLPQAGPAYHADPKYRSAWECLLIEPPSRVTYLMERDSPPTAVGALSVIGSEESIPVLVLRFRYPRNGTTERDYILKALSGIGSEAALRGMLDCVPVSEEGKPLTQEEAVRDHVSSYLAGRAISGKYGLSTGRLPLAANWRRVMAGFSREGLTEEQKAFLEQVEAVQEKNKDLLDRYDSKKK